MFGYKGSQAFKQLLIWSTFLTVTAAPSAVAAKEHLLSPGSDPIAIYREAGIDEAQERKILGMANAYEKAEDAKARQLIAHIKKLKTLSLSPELDEDTIIKTQEEINKLQGEMAMEKIHLLFVIRKSLTNEQKVRLVGLMQNRTAPDNMMQPGRSSPALNQ